MSWFPFPATSNVACGWDRSRARQREGEGLPVSPFRSRGGFTISPASRFPRPPYDPGRPSFSGPVRNLGLSSMSLPIAPRGLSAGSHAPLLGHGLLITALHYPFPVNRPVLSSRARVGGFGNRQGPESLCPGSDLPSLERRSTPPRRALPLLPRSYGLTRQSHWALLSFGF